MDNEQSIAPPVYQEGEYDLIQQLAKEKMAKKGYVEPQQPKSIWDKIAQLLANAPEEINSKIMALTQLLDKLKASKVNEGEKDDLATRVSNVYRGAQE